jgi:hypothetical protein
VVNVVAFTRPHLRQTVENIYVSELVGKDATVILKNSTVETEEQKLDME